MLYFYEFYDKYFREKWLGNLIDLGDFFIRENFMVKDKNLDWF